MFDTPLTATAWGRQMNSSILLGTATPSIASRYIGGGFQNGDFDNVTVTTSGNVDTFAGWEAHRRQVMLAQMQIFSSLSQHLSANETTGTISADETVLTSIKTFSDLTTSAGGSFSLSTADDGEPIHLC